MEFNTIRKDWWDEARNQHGVSAVDFEYIPLGDKVVVKAKVVAKDVVAAYGVVTSADPRNVGAAQVKAIRKALQFIKGEFEQYEENGNGSAKPQYQKPQYQKKTYNKPQYQQPAETRKCEVCGAELTPGVAKYSKDHYGVYLCREHQQEAQGQ